jgi:hypothetical protein
MSIDIREGDVLTVAGKDYPVRSAAGYVRFGITRTFQRLATVEASTKRAPAFAGGKRGAPEVYLDSVLCSPLDPVDPELRQRLGLSSPYELAQTYVADEDGFIKLVLEVLPR